MIHEQDILSLVRLRSLLSPGAFDYYAMLKRLEFKVTPDMVMRTLRAGGIDSAYEVEKLVREHLGTKFAEECIKSLEIKSKRRWEPGSSNTESITYWTEAIVLSKKEFIETIAFCIENYSPPPRVENANNDQDETV